MQASEVALNGFNSTVKIIKKITVAQVPKRQVEELAQKSASDFDQFYVPAIQKFEGR